MAIQDEIENINDIICNIKVLMEDYFYTQSYINSHYATLEHTHPIDTTLLSTSTNPVTNKAITEELNNKADNTVADSSHNGLMSSNAFTKLEAIQEEATKNIIDTSLSTTSTNAVQNKAVTTALNSKANNLLANNSRDGLMSQGDYSKLSQIENQATKTIIDTSLSDSSTNPVQNKVINTALNTKADKNTIATVNNNGLMSSEYVNTITNLQQQVYTLENKVDKNDVRIKFLRYKNGTFEGGDGTQLVCDKGTDYVYAQIECDDPNYNKAGHTIRLVINGMVYDRTTDNNGRTTSGKLIGTDFPSGTRIMYAFMSGGNDKNPIHESKILVVP